MGGDCSRYALLCREISIRRWDFEPDPRFRIVLENLNRDPRCGPAPVHWNPMTTDDLLAATAIAVVLSGLGVAIGLFRKSGQARFELLAPAFELGTCRKIGPWGAALEGLFQGYSCRYIIQPASQNNPGGAVLRVAITGGVPWSAEMPGAGTRLMIRMGILQDLEIGEPDLDSSLRFAAGDENALRNLFGSTQVRASFRRITEGENLAGVRVTPHRFEIRWAPRNRDLDEDVGVLRQRLENAVGSVAACRYPPRFEA